MAVKDPKENYLLPFWMMGHHTYIVGLTGMGKSRAIASFVLQAIAQGKGVAVFDAHGDLFEELVSGIARLTEKLPELLDRTVIINPLDRVWTVRFNPLESIPGISFERLTAFLMDVVVKVWKIDSDAPRMRRLLKCTFLALTELGLPLIDLPRFLRDAGWRESLLGHIVSPEVVSYFRDDFPATEAGSHQWREPVLNRMNDLLFDKDLRLIFSGRSTINLRQIMDQRGILLVNLSRGLLGEGNGDLLGAFLVAYLQKTALARADSPWRPPFYLFLDEFEHYTTDNIQEMLEETRKYGLLVTLAHQYLDQLDPGILKAAVNTAGTILCFRVGYQDATVLAHELFPPRCLAKAHWQLRTLRFGGWPLPIPYQEYEPLAHEELVALLTQLEKREFVVKHRGPYPPVKLRTLDLRAPIMTEKLCLAREELIRHSGQRYGKLKAEVRREVEHARSEENVTISGQYRIITAYEEKTAA